MASSYPPPKGVALDLPIALFAQSDNQIKTTPTIAAGDIQLSKNFGAFANPATLPAETTASSGVVKVA
jgi:hypothetical protein